MRFFFFSALLLLAASVRAQHRKARLHLVYSPEYTASDPRGTGGSSDAIVEAREKRETGRYGFTAGMLVQWPLRGRWALQTGLLFSDKGEKGKRQPVYFASPGPGPDPLQLAFHETSYAHYQYLSVPARVGYRLKGGRWSLTALAGLSGNIYLGQRTHLHLETPNGEKEQQTRKGEAPFSRLHLGGEAGLALDLPLYRQLRLRLQPTYRRSLMSASDAPVKVHFWSAGLEAGVHLPF